MMIFRTTIENFKIYQAADETRPFVARRQLLRFVLAIILALALYPVRLTIEAARTLDRGLDSAAEGLSALIYGNVGAQAGRIVGRALQYGQLAVIALAMAIFAPLLSPMRIMAL